MSNKLNAFAPGSGPGSTPAPAPAPTTSNYKFQGVPISELIAPDGTTAVTKYSGLKYNTTTDPAAKVGTDSFVNVFKDSNNPLPSNIKAKEYNISDNTTIPEWANAFRFRIQTNAGNAGDNGQAGEQGNQTRVDGVHEYGWTGFAYPYQKHHHSGGQGGLGATGKSGGAGGAGGKGIEVYSDFIPIDPDGSSIILNTTTGFKIKKGQKDVFNININAANNGQNGFDGADGSNGQAGENAVGKFNNQQGYHGSNGQNGILSIDKTNMLAQGEGKPGGDGNNSNVEGTSVSGLVSNDRNSTTGASSKIYFFKKSTTT